MKPVLLDFNGTLFSDTCFHMEAWSEIYRELHENTNEVPDSSFFCGPRNDDIIHAIAPDMPRAEREQCSVHKEALYRSICRKNPDKLHLTKGAPAPGPISMSQSASFRICVSWSTSSTEFPSATRSRITPFNPTMLEGCSPMEGSSSTYSTPVVLLRTARASCIRCRSPVERVDEARSSVR